MRVRCGEGQGAGEGRNHSVWNMWSQAQSTAERGITLWGGTSRGRTGNGGDNGKGRKVKRYAQGR